MNVNIIIVSLKCQQKNSIYRLNTYVLYQFQNYSKGNKNLSGVFILQIFNVRIV
jgi:hypothetical protein